MAYVNSGAQIRGHRVCPIRHIVAAGGADIRQYLDYLPGLTDLLGRVGEYIEYWVREFYATLWIDRAHEDIHFSFRGQHHRLTSDQARQRLRLTPSANRLHTLCYKDKQPPRRPLSAVAPDTEFVRPCFREPFGDGSHHTPADLTPTARLLHEVMRKTLLPRVGYREGLTQIQLWLLAHLVTKTEFDVSDVILSDMEDTIAEGFRGRRQLPYAHWICWLLLTVADRCAPESQRALRDTTTIFPTYDMRQVSLSLRPPRDQRQTRERAPVAETEAEQDEAIGTVADTELADLDAHPTDHWLEGLSSDSSEEDYQPEPLLPRCRHDHEAGGSGSAPAERQSDPALLALLERMQHEQQRQAEEQRVATA